MMDHGVSKTHSFELLVLHKKKKNKTKETLNSSS